jgi:hypothetical protein
MSIFDTLAESGVTQEDLEKAASARLFAEAAAAEGIDLSELSEDQAEELYDFWANGGNAGEEKYASAEEMLAEAAVKEAGAKLAEAEYIGRYMARVYSDEMAKIAKDEMIHVPGKGRSVPGGTITRVSKDSGDAVSGTNRARQLASKYVPGVEDILEGMRERKMQIGGHAGALKAHGTRRIAKGAGKLGLTAGAVGGAGYLANKAMKKESAFDTVVEQRAMAILEALQEPSFDEAIDEAAIDLLRANGYDV